MVFTQPRSEADIVVRLCDRLPCNRVLGASLVLSANEVSVAAIILSVLMPRSD